ncbi:MAG: peptidogalycan biosysnthesis protein, partial [Thiotrichaceae bacterium]
MQIIKIHQHISEIPAEQWNALIVDNNPFIRHEFLQALEDNQCVGKEFGWLPRHIAIYNKDKKGKATDLMAAMPLYEKYNSYGEFVFDHAWADAWQRAGLQYFPKLVSSVPYTPAQGQRLLAQPEDLEKAAPMLLQVAMEIAKQNNMSGCHILFPSATEQQWLEQQDVFVRHDCQFHWRNKDYQNFD